MEEFLHPHEYNFIKKQTKVIVDAQSTNKDQDVVHTVITLAREKVAQLVEGQGGKALPLLDALTDVKNAHEADSFLLSLKPYVIPFPRVSEKKIERLFPKEKKLKVPDLEQFDYHALSYLGWYDLGTNKKYLVVNIEGRLMGVAGLYHPSSKQGLCTICHSFGEVGLFTKKIKGRKNESTISRGNYVCKDSMVCNDNMTSLDELNAFIYRLHQ
ncbi:FusB/FusC family EF-G-binding protein [Salipaludibacillus agaradhaerens]|uniref:FusB/FusC family EF-G-binding protein n=1 Tax=Salipaludibacillus agaradhaerens TaxID=76935 RepID=A0A9Q4B391_SALAG|nr:FusB/FusC family EF-G-binding protein [Salipaludibacillus agaradhaerens]MCR6097529.1 FusB/FusC family EF-G-binding protein [Salipaludibacillus agaradhaerens]MCR6112987.1 FusB/FusC family EF-G-binding protein [Salipaludibacillus agaradhaerens]